MMSLTPSQIICARCIAELTEHFGRPPRITELSDELDMAVGGVSGLLDRLADRGWLAPHKYGRRAPLVLLAIPPALPEPAFELLPNAWAANV